MTLAERLKALSGISGATVGQMLAAIAPGGSMAEIVVAYSGLAVATVEQHLLATSQPQEEPGFAGGMTWRPYKHRPREEDEALLLAVLH